MDEYLEYAEEPDYDNCPGGYVDYWPLRLCAILFCLIGAPLFIAGAMMKVPAMSVVGGIAGYLCGPIVAFLLSRKLEYSTLKVILWTIPAFFFFGIPNLVLAIQKLDLEKLSTSNESSAELALMSFIFTPVLAKVYVEGKNPWVLVGAIVCGLLMLFFIYRFIKKMQRIRWFTGKKT